LTLLGPGSRAALEQLLALDSDDTAKPLDRIRALRAAWAALDSDPAALTAVRAALEAGASWSDVAQAAQLSPAASRWRWQGDDAEIAARHEAGRKRSERPSSKPADLPGLSVAEAAKQLGVTAQAIYLRVSRGQLRAEAVTLADGRSYKRVFPTDAASE
jgi:transposase-like protein